MRKPKLLKHLHSSRLLLPLASCSLVLVVFSAVVYVAAVPGALSGDQEASPLFGYFPNATVASASDAPVDSVSGANVTTPVSASLLTLASPVLKSSALQEAAPQLNALVNAKVEKAKESEKQNSAAAGENVEAAPNDVVSSSQGATSESVSSQEESAAANEAKENAYHAHIAKYYAELPTYYNHLCSGLNNAYAAINSAGSSRAYVSVSPVDAASYIRTIDKKRVEAQDCTYNDDRIDSNSKWYGEYTKVWRLYENLVNITSIMREINGSDTAWARERLAYYSNANGKIRELAEFEQNYPKVHL